MISFDIMKNLMKCFPGSFINEHGEFIAHEKANQYFNLSNCETELDVKCKVLEWFSRAAFKTEFCRNPHSNNLFRGFMLNGINDFLGTKFDTEIMREIYINIGNCCNHEKTIRFIESGYDLEMLQEETPCE